MVRLIHTSNVHLDACFAAAGMSPAQGNVRRQGLRDALKRVLRRAVEWPADAVLIAGDLIELDRVGRDTITFLKEEFERAAPLPIIIAPGKRDPFVPHSPYAAEPWPANVVIFEGPSWSARPLQNSSLTIHGVAHGENGLANLLFDELTPPADGRIHIALAYGFESGVLSSKDSQGPGAFKAADAVRPNLAYVALGGSRASKAVLNGAGTKAWFCGAPEGLGFADSGEHGFLEIEIDGVTVQVHRTASSKAEYISYRLDCSTFRSSADIVEGIRALAWAKDVAQIANVTLNGVCRPEWRYEIDAITRKASSAFEFLSVTDAMKSDEDYEAIGEECTSLGGFIAQINSEYVDASDLELRRLLDRVREVGLAAYRAAEPPLGSPEQG